MNNYVEIDDKKYMTQEWQPIYTTPAQARPVLSGRIDVVSAPVTLLRYEGVIIVPVTPEDENWGDVEDFRGIYNSGVVADFKDHYGTAGTILFVGDIVELSRTKMWDGASNEYHIPVQVQVL